MSSAIDIARAELLKPANIGDSQLESILGSMLGNNVDAADIYLQHVKHESWVLEEGIVKDASYNIDQGVGLRVVSGEKTGLAYSDDIIMPSLMQAADAAKTIAKSPGKSQLAKLQIRSFKPLYPATNPLISLSQEDKIALLKAVDTYARAQDSRVSQVIANLSARHEIVYILTSEGTISADVRPLIRFSVQVIAKQGDRIEAGSSGGGGRYSYEKFIANDLAYTFTKQAVEQAIINLDAVAAPAGNMPVVLGPGWPGVLLHEAIGHGLEGDFNRKGSSAFAGRIGERVASTLCTIVDDGTLTERRGSLSIDDEGVETNCTTLIENGILKNYMLDKLNAKLMGMQSTGNGRRESYAHQPMPRMTNTYMLAGEHDPEEIIASVDKGIYAVNFGGGQVDITSGKFVFSANLAYLIENGKITAPVKGATLIGNGPDVLTKVSMVGNNLELDTGIGVCGKEGQSVPVGVGQPTLKVDELTVGGTKG